MAARTERHSRMQCASGKFTTTRQKTMEKGALDSAEAQEVIERMKLSELIASMKIDDGDTAMMIALFFEGKKFLTHTQRLRRL